MDPQSSHSQTDAIKAISNVLREPAPRSGGELRETTAATLSRPAPAPASISAESKTPSECDDAGLPGPSSGRRHLRNTLWRFVVLCVEPIFRRLREYLLEPLALLHERLNGRVVETRAATERIQLQMQLIRADLDVLPKQLVHLEFQSRNLAKQLAHLEGQISILADQLKHLKSQGG